MMIENPSSPPEQSPTRIIEDILGNLEEKGSDLPRVPLEVAEEVGTSVGGVNEVQKDRGLD